MTIIRVLSVGILLAMTTSASAQDDKPKAKKDEAHIAVGPIAGASFSNGDVYHDNMFVATGNLVRLRVGALAEFEIVRKLFIQPSIAYTVNGFLLNGTVRLRSVEFPLNLQYKLGGFKGSGLFIGTGLYYSITGYAVQSSWDDPQKDHQLRIGTDGDAAIAPGMFGWSVNLGYQSSTGVFFRVAWNNGMSDYIPGNQGATYHPYQLNFCFGYLFKTSKARAKTTTKNSQAFTSPMNQRREHAHLRLTS
jgi:hypothetical protein